MVRELAPGRRHAIETICDLGIAVQRLRVSRASKRAKIGNGGGVDVEASAAGHLPPSPSSAGGRLGSDRSGNHEYFG